jgi:hypothetical protein
LKLDPPTNRRQVRHLIGAITFYRDFYRRRSHILAPLTKLTGKGSPFRWTDECQQSFDQLKAVIAHEAFIRYPDHNAPFHV